jgi:murein DD-endopeptidase MepM/ murein hydrolase activator NlpD
LAIDDAKSGKRFMRSSHLLELTPFLLLSLFCLAACSSGQIGTRVGDDLVVKSRYGKAWALSTNPTEIGTLSSGFGYRRHPITGLNKPHRGIDLAAPRGTPVIAAADGVVLFQGDRGTYGNLSRIKHGRDVVTAYAHLDRFELGLVPGMSVRKGDVIGYVGTSGRSSGPHLHYEVILHGQWIDPLGGNEKEFADHGDHDVNADEGRFDVVLR